jgi:adenylate cyclase
MPQETEHKFLVTGDSWRAAGGHSVRLAQGYLSRDPERVVRVRLAGETAFITIKGLTTGVTRPEFEYSIPIEDARELLKLCAGTVLDKTRTTLDHGGHTWVIDEFHGDNAGLIMAEIELQREGEPFEIPPWAGAEVSGEARYYNSNLSNHPYRDW